jgi:hypothetical protein
MTTDSLFREINEALDQGDDKRARGLASVGAIMLQALALAEVAGANHAAAAAYFASAVCLAKVAQEPS